MGHGEHGAEFDQCAGDTGVIAQVLQCCARISAPRSWSISLAGGSPSVGHRHL
ncbi:hypothetical protein HMPREF0970_00753 [Schaalia odontolytica F0309]|uniref:Uncharacterized protein n=1 Tax=Schaalia odontolytica F0309 TaxID=649742 RepID=D4TXT4_9ACTO|nr:hypothetical protein HMPREF0970_00753 [Schaalia odontolytica F0309]